MGEVRPPRRAERALVLLAIGGGLLLASVARAQDESLTLAFYGPNIFFSDSVARAGFVTDLAAQIEAAVGVSVEGVNLSSPNNLGDADFAIIDGIVFSESPRGEPIGSARGPGGDSAPLALIVSSSGPSRLSDLSGRTLILPRGSDRLVEFITAEVLHSEIDAAEFFGSIDYTSNVESALSAVAGGQADATLAFADYGSRGGLRVLSRYGDAPMPVVVQINRALDGGLAERVSGALRAASVSGEINGFSSYDAEALGAFERRSTRQRAELTPLMTRARTVTVAPGDIELPDVTEPLVLGSPVGLVELPEMVEP